MCCDEEYEVHVYYSFTNKDQTGSPVAGCSETAIFVSLHFNDRS